MKRTHAHGRAACLLVAGLITPIFAAIAAGPTGSPSLALPQTTACLNAAVTAGRSNNSLSGIAAAVVLDGRIVYHRGFGTVSPTSTQAVLPSTRFRTGSVNKMMTATAVLSLAEEGRIRMHAPVSELLPGFSLSGEPGWSNRLTAHRLLSHQGGIVDSGELNGPHDDGALAAAFYDPGFLQTVPLMVSPGTFYNYSNPNFSLAGLLAETAAGKAYRHVMRQRVFKPLGMKRTTFLSSDVLADNDFAYGMQGTTVIAPDAYDNAIMRPAGFAWGTVDDLARFMMFILRGDREVLSPRMWRALQARQVNTFQQLDLQGYGYGLVVEEAAVFPDSTGQPRFYDGLKVVWHDGAIAGYQSFMATLPKQQFGYVALMNADPDNPAPDLAPCFRVAAAETISSRLPAPSPFPDPRIQRDRFIDYVGNYADRVGVSGPAVLALAPNGDLTVRFPALDLEEVVYDPVLQPVSRDNFLLHLLGTSILVTGFREAGDEVVHLRTRLTVITRTSDAQASLRAASPTIDRAALEKAVRAAARERTTLIPRWPDSGAE